MIDVYLALAFDTYWLPVTCRCAKEMDIQCLLYADFKYTRLSKGLWELCVLFPKILVFLHLLLSTISFYYDTL